MEIKTTYQRLWDANWAVFRIHFTAVIAEMIKKEEITKHSKPRASKLQPTGHVWPCPLLKMKLCWRTTWYLRVFCRCFHATTAVEWLWRTPHDSQNQTYLLSSPLQKTLANYDRSFHLEKLVREKYLHNAGRKQKVIKIRVEINWIKNKNRK